MDNYDWLFDDYPPIKEAYETLRIYRPEEWKYIEAGRYLYSLIHAPKYKWFVFKLLIKKHWKLLLTTLVPAIGFYLWIIWNIMKLF